MKTTPKFTLLFYLWYRISFKNLNEEKKPHQKLLIFDEGMACQRSPFFGPLKNDLKFSHGIWRHWSTEVENEQQFSLKHHLNKVLQFSWESISVRYIVAFLCKKDIWVHKMCLVVWNPTILPVWRRKHGIWANLGKSPYCSNVVIIYIIWTFVSYSNASNGLVFQYNGSSRI